MSAHEAENLSVHMAPQEIRDWALKRMTNDDLERVHGECLTVLERLMGVTGGDPYYDLVRPAMDGESTPAAAWFAHQAIWPLRWEMSTRERLEHRAEVAIEANGHELQHIDGAMFEDAPGHFVVCTCGYLTDERGGRFVETDAQARAIGDAHIAETGGRWYWRDER